VVHFGPQSLVATDHHEFVRIEDVASDLPHLLHIVRAVQAAALEIDTGEDGSGH